MYGLNEIKAMNAPRRRRDAVDPTERAKQEVLARLQRTVRALDYVPVEASTDIRFGLRTRIETLRDIAICVFGMTPEEVDEASGERRACPSSRAGEEEPRGDDLGSMWG